jgi:predicted TIM-barrel fold metal-dependent hydrolase
MKKCSTCKKKKFDREFYKRNDTKDGLSYACKTCISKRNKLRYLKRKDVAKHQKELDRRFKISVRRTLPKKIKAAEEKAEKKFNLFKFLGLGDIFTL